MDKKRILVVDDDLTAQRTIAMILRLQGYIADTAGTGGEAIEKSNFNSYDLAIIDFRLPDMEGTKLLSAIREPPTGMVKIMLTGYPTVENEAEAKNGNASAFLVKPVRIENLLRTVGDTLRQQSKRTPAGPNPSDEVGAGTEFILVAIGASAGGPKALEQVLSNIPRRLPAAFVVSQHIPNGFTKPLAERLDRVSELRVREAEMNDIVRPGEVLITPGGYDMEVIKSGRIRLQKTDHNLAPSIDAMMRSAAESYGSRTIGVLLTGMLTDGVEGLRTIKEKGGITIVQDENSSVVYGMPKAALDAGVAVVVADIFKIPDIIINTTLTKTIEPSSSNSVK